MDVFESAGHKLAILDVSATAHMPDVIEMPYRPDVFLIEKSAEPSSSQLPCVTLPSESYQLASDEISSHTYRLGGPTCLAGDVIGDYNFPRPLAAGDILVFDDMAHYTMVKTTTFNGVKHPAIALLHPDGNIETIRTFTYKDFRDRLS
jgi:carboxynorspermidine decarboxylase